MRILLCAHARTLVCCAPTARVPYLRCLSVDSIVRVAVFDPLHSQVNPNIHVEVFIHKVRTNPQSAQLLCDPMQLSAWLHGAAHQRSAPKSSASGELAFVFAPHRSTGCRTTRRLSISRTLRRSAVPCRAVRRAALSHGTQLTLRSRSPVAHVIQVVSCTCAAACDARPGRRRPATHRPRAAEVTAVPLDVWSANAQCAQPVESSRVESRTIQHNPTCNHIGSTQVCERNGQHTTCSMQQMMCSMQHDVQHAA